MSKPKLRVSESSDFWRSVKSASHEIYFTEHPWKYGTDGAGRLYWAREFFKRLHHAMIAYAGSCAATGEQIVQPRRIDTDLLLDATSQRAALLELE